MREALITYGVVFLAGCFRLFGVCLFARNLREFYGADIDLVRGLLSTETLPKIFNRPISVLKSNPRKVGLAITASLELTQNRDLFLELFWIFYEKVPFSKLAWKINLESRALVASSHVDQEIITKEGNRVKIAPSYPLQTWKIKSVSWKISPD